VNAQRITVLVVLTLVAVYVAIVHQANPVPIALPGLLSLPLWLILLGTGLLAYLAGWLPGAIRTWRLRTMRSGPNRSFRTGLPHPHRRHGRAMTMTHPTPRRDAARSLRAARDSRSA